MHETHSERAEHEGLAPQRVAQNRICPDDFLSQTLAFAGRHGREDRTDLRQGLLHECRESIIHFNDSLH